MPPRVSRRRVEKKPTRQMRWLLAGASAGLAVDFSLYSTGHNQNLVCKSKAGFSGHRADSATFYARGTSGGGGLGSQARHCFSFTYCNGKKCLRNEFGTSIPLPLVDATECHIWRIGPRVWSVCPLKIVKKQRQSDDSRVTDCYNLSSEGTVAREIPFSFIEFPLWEWLKRRVAQRIGHCSPLASAACGSLAGLTAAALTTPFDVLKTRVMLDRDRRTRLLPTALHILRNEGIVCVLSLPINVPKKMCLSSISGPSLFRHFASGIVDGRRWVHFLLCL
ncbi:hypothetical protein niasHT_001940 [Heterodera trifolii]|uniref:Mitochondrial carrier protein n=1 Tax=Heterodera trifolii TaxID=157864 RepID=A0ABD2LSS0_9BILA